MWANFGHMRMFARAQFEVIGGSCQDRRWAHAGPVLEFSQGSPNQGLVALCARAIIELSRNTNIMFLVFYGFGSVSLFDVMFLCYCTFIVMSLPSKPVVTQ
jgi:hypothetical protein